MEDMLESLCIRAELDLWKGRQRIYGSRHKALGSAYILKKDCVEQMERSLRKFIPFLARDYEDELEVKKAEMDVAKKAYEQVLFYMEEGEKRVKVLEALGKTKSHDGNVALGGLAKKMLGWCELVEEITLLADEISNFIKDLRVYMERNNNEMVENKDAMIIKERVDEINKSGDRIFGKVKLEYGLEELFNKRKHINFQWSGLRGRWHLADALQDNAQLYAVGNDMEMLQLLLIEVFTVLEQSGESLLEEGRRAEENAEVSMTREMPADADQMNEKTSSYYSKMGNGSWDEKFQEMPIVSKWELEEKENMERKRVQLLKGIGILCGDVKSIRADIQRSFGKKHIPSFSRRQDSMDEEEALSSIQKMEQKIKTLSKDLREYRKHTGHFPCALDRFLPFENRILERGLKAGDKERRKEFYFSYVDEVEVCLQSAEKQICESCSDS